MTEVDPYAYQPEEPDDGGAHDDYFASGFGDGPDTALHFDPEGGEAEGGWSDGSFDAIDQPGQNHEPSNEDEDETTEEDTDDNLDDTLPEVVQQDIDPTPPQPSPSPHPSSVEIPPESVEDIQQQPNLTLDHSRVNQDSQSHDNAVHDPSPVQSDKLAVKEEEEEPIQTGSPPSSSQVSSPNPPENALPTPTALEQHTEPQVQTPQPSSVPTQEVPRSQPVSMKQVPRATSRLIQLNEWIATLQNKLRAPAPGTTASSEAANATGPEPATPSKIVHTRVENISERLDNLSRTMVTPGGRTTASRLSHVNNPALAALSPIAPLNVSMLSSQSRAMSLDGRDPRGRDVLDLEKRSKDLQCQLMDVIVAGNAAPPLLSPASELRNRTDSMKMLITALFENYGALREVMAQERGVNPRLGAAYDLLDGLHDIVSHMSASVNALQGGLSTAQAEMMDSKDRAAVLSRKVHDLHSLHASELAAVQSKLDAATRDTTMARVSAKQSLYSSHAALRQCQADFQAAQELIAELRGQKSPPPSETGWADEDVRRELAALNAVKNEMRQDFEQGIAAAKAEYDAEIARMQGEVGILRAELSRAHSNVSNAHSALVEERRHSAMVMMNASGARDGHGVGGFGDLSLPPITEHDNDDDELTEPHGAVSGLAFADEGSDTESQNSEGDVDDEPSAVWQDDGETTEAGEGGREEIVSSVVGKEDEGPGIIWVTFLLFITTVLLIAGVAVADENDVTGIRRLLRQSEAFISPHVREWRTHFGV